MRTIIVVLIMSIVYISFRGQISFLMALLIMAPLVALGSISKKTDERGEQNTRNRKFQPVANEQFEAFKAGASPVTSKRFILFLRPFKFDRLIRVKNPRRDHWAIWLMVVYKFFLSPWVTLDDALRIHLKSFGDLVAMGAPGELTGATRAVASDAEWEAFFLAQARAARAIIILVGRFPGTMTEIQHIASHGDFLRKTLFLLPATSMGDTIDDLRTLLSNSGLSLPASVQFGQGFIYDADKRPLFSRNILRGHSAIAKVDRSKLRGTVRTILAGAAQADSEQRVA